MLPCCGASCKPGRSGGTRTPDRWFWRPLLFQLSYAPVLSISYATKHRDPRSRICEKQDLGSGHEETMSGYDISRMLVPRDRIPRPSRASYDLTLFPGRYWN